MRPYCHGGERHGSAVARAGNESSSSGQRGPGQNARGRPAAHT
ncbi:MAG: hypothetical protein J6K72_09185 [Clostridia bacterium]|nr:hypothetical protein [Clostridia bacterium]